jgi:hypothetical protein
VSPDFYRVFYRINRQASACGPIGRHALAALMASSSGRGRAGHGLLLRPPRWRAERRPRSR